MIERMRACKIEFAAGLEGMSAFRKADRIRKLLKWADGLARRCHTEWRIRHSSRPRGETGLLHIGKLTTHRREAIHHLLRGIDSILLTSAIPATSLVQRRRALPGIALQAKSKFV